MEAGLDMANATDVAADRPSAGPSGRFAGLLLIASAVASVALLANHPGGEASDFAGMLKSEAADQLMNAVVHAGFIVVLTVEMAAYAILSTRLASRSAAIIGMTFFAVGALFMMGSLLVDGLAVPAIAARYAAATPEKIESARVLFVLIGALLQFLMPIGLAFQGLGVACWGAALLQGPARAIGAVGVLLGVGVVTAIGLAMFAGQMMMLFAAIGGMALWALIAGVTMFRRTL